MFLNHYQPWTSMNDWNKEISDLFSLPRYSQVRRQVSNDQTWAPAVDIKEEADQYLIYAEIPGIDPKDIEITCEDGVLSIKGECISESKEELEKYTRRERVKSAFSRRFNLPDTADTESISARGKNGVLEIAIKKQPEVQPRKIKVDVLN